MIETPSIYSRLTVDENLEVWRKIYGCPRGRVAEVLEPIGLAKSANLMSISDSSTPQIEAKNLFRNLDSP